MKTISCKLDDNVFDQAEKLTTVLKLSRNRYINEAIHLYNQCIRRKFLKEKLSKESILTNYDSMDVLHEFEKLIDKH